MLEKWGARHTFILMSFLFMLLAQSMKVNLSVAIVAMVNSQESNYSTKVDTSTNEVSSFLYPNVCLEIE